MASAAVGGTRDKGRTSPRRAFSVFPSRVRRRLSRLKLRQTANILKLETGLAPKRKFTTKVKIFRKKNRQVTAYSLEIIRISRTNNQDKRAKPPRPRRKTTDNDAENSRLADRLI
jgi:hypothetical protein